MPASPPNIQLSNLNINSKTLEAIKSLLNYIEPFVDEGQPDIQAYILQLKNEVSQLQQGKKAKTGMIHATESDLRRAFGRHYDARHKIEEICSYLLLFYAVECGLKSVLLKRRKLPSTDRLDNSFLSHNFAPLIKELRLPRNVVGNVGYTSDLSHPKLPGFRLNRDNSGWSMSEVHQAWRYGVRIQSEDESTVIKWLQQVCIWIKENHNR